uniref:Uncharacterized protein n=1 Tax=Echeneis naucrates TaxID=173247 RepID=A0A665TSH6_ECHNA
MKTLFYLLGRWFKAVVSRKGQVLKLWLSPLFQGSFTSVFFTVLEHKHTHTRSYQRQTELPTSLFSHKGTENTSYCRPPPRASRSRWRFFNSLCELWGLSWKMFGI